MKSAVLSCGAALLAGLTTFAFETYRPLRTPPKETATVDAGFRDWSPVSLVGNTLLGGNQTGRGGLLAIDAAAGKVKWTFRPAFKSGTASVSTPPSVIGDVVLASFSMAHPGVVVAVSIQNGKELWRGPDPAINVATAAHGNLFIVFNKTAQLSAHTAATGQQQWAVQFANDRAVCELWPVARDGTLYMMALANATPGDSTKPAGYYLFAIDAATGTERWRYRAEAPYIRPGVCLRQIVVDGETIFAAGDEYVYAIDRASGANRFKPIQVTHVANGRSQAAPVLGLADAGEVVVGITAGALVAFDKRSGRTAWQVPGEYSPTARGMAVAGDVLYFQGSPASRPAAASRGTLHALDLQTRAILWSFSRPTEEAHWAFGHITPFDQGVWVDSYRALVRLQ